MRLSSRLRWWLKSVLPSTFIALIAGVFACPGVALARDLTFAQRVEAQRAIERVYYIHRSGGARGFEEAVSGSLLERKVRTYLAESVALEDLWHTPVTATMLLREVDRMTSRSRLPQRLAEIRAALGGDDALLAETLARATLVDRLCRSFLAADTRFPSQSWDGWRASAEKSFDPARARGAIDALVRDAAVVPAPGAASCAFQDLWATGQGEGIPRPRSLNSAVWTGSEMILWGDDDDGSAFVPTGDRYDPATDTWTHTTMMGAPTPRKRHTAVWTGTRMIVWGGDSVGGYTNTGAIYDPASDAWTPTSLVNAPPPTAGHGAVWTGTLMLVWGGDLGVATGGRYDPAFDTWTPITTVGTPASYTESSVVWTGTEMIIWGGNRSNTGARYNPVTDIWTPTSTVNAPTTRQAHTAIWTGTEMIIWGGFFGGYTPSGGRYNPATDTWTATNLIGAPANRYYHSAVWTGHEMIVWGGIDFSHSPPNPMLNTGGRYDPITDSWRPTSTLNAPPARSRPSAVWTGDLMIIGGGREVVGGRYDPGSDSWTPTSYARNSPLFTTRAASVWTGAEMIVWSYPEIYGGGLYDATTDTWTSTSTIGAPSERENARAVWTGSEMLIWGGDLNGSPLRTGSRYRPLTDTWTPITTVGAPSASGTAVWTGTEMIVWGGVLGSSLQGTGARYDPTADTWSVVNPVGAPSPRSGHAAVWTGTEMVIWGGTTASGITSTGARFDAAANGGAGAWTATTLMGAPSGASTRAVVWTGKEMIVWSGPPSASGGRYDPATDHWTTMSTVNAPPRRNGSSVVWAGDQMIIWGGWLSTGPDGDVSYNDGARYDPIHDTWTPTSTVGTPSPRAYHASVWTGRAMLVWDGEFFSGDTSDLIDDVAMHWYGNAVAAPPADLDGDGVSDCLDCDDGNPAAWSTPGEVTGLAFGGDAETISWSPPADLGGLAVEYDLIRSVVASDYESSAVCLASDIPSTSANDAASPATDGIFFYLARARNGCPGGSGVGSVGAGSSGVERAALVCP